MASIDYGTGPNTTTGDTIPVALGKLKARLIAAGFDPGLGDAATIAVAVRRIEATLDVAEEAYVPPVPGTPTPTPPPAPVFTVQPSISPASGVAGATFTATDGAASNTTGYTRRWLLNGTSIGTGQTVVPVTAGALSLEVTANGPGGSTIATSAAVTVSSGTPTPTPGPTLNALTVSPSSGTVGTAYTGTISGRTAGSSLALTGPGAAGLSLSGTTINGTSTATGAVNIVETLAGATNSPRTSSGVLSVMAAVSTETKPRVWINTDFSNDGSTDPDDEQLMYMTLLFSDVINLRGFGTNAIGNPGRTATTARSQLLALINGAYATDYPALSAANPDYPTASTLAARTYAGLASAHSTSMTTRTNDASTALIAEAKAAQAAGVPLWVQEWGPHSVLAQAIFQDPSIIPTLRVYSIDPGTAEGKHYNYNKDPVAADYINERVLNAGLWQIHSVGTFWGFYRPSDGTRQGMTGWIEQFARGRGALGAALSVQNRLRVTSPTGYKAGDGGSFTYVIDNVLRGIGEDPTQPGWGGRFDRNTALGPNAWVDSGLAEDTMGTAANNPQGVLKGARTLYRQRGPNGINGGYMPALEGRFARLPFAGVKVGFEVSTASVTEGQTLTIAAKRATDDVYGNTRAFTVDYALVGSGGSPLSAADFGGTLPSGTLSFSGGTLNADDRTVTGAELSKTITLTPTTDAGAEGVETGTLVLSNFTNGAIAGDITSTSISVSDPSSTLPAGQFVLAKFDGPAGTDVRTGYVSEGGGTYLPIGGSNQAAILDGNGGVYKGATDGVMYNTNAPATADYASEVDILKLSTITGDTAGVGVRMSTTASTFYWFRYSVPAGGWQLYKTVNGSSSTQIGSTVAAAFPDGETRTLRLSVQGSTLTASVNGVTVIGPTTDTSIAAAGYSGFRLLGAVQTETTGMHILEHRSFDL